MIKAVLFDLGGTLHTSSSSQERELWFAQRLLTRLDDYGIRLDTTPQLLACRLRHNAEVYKQATERSLRELPAPEIWSQYYLAEYQIPEESLASFAEELSFLYDYERVRVMRRPNLVQTMERLHAMGLRLGIISNIISTSVVPHFLREYGIDSYMETVITSSETGIRKPDPEIFRRAERAMCLSAGEMAYVGDTLSRDVRGAQAAGWRLMIKISNPSIAHRDVGLDPAEFRADYCIDDLSQIPEIIARENNCCK